MAFIVDGPFMCSAILLRLLWFPWLFHSFSMVLELPSPGSLLTLNRGQNGRQHSLDVHSTNLPMMRTLLFSSTQLTANVSSPSLLPSTTSCITLLRLSASFMYPGAVRLPSPLPFPYLQLLPSYQPQH